MEIGLKLDTPKIRFSCTGLRIFFCFLHATSRKPERTFEMRISVPAGFRPCLIVGKVVRVTFGAVRKLVGVIGNTPCTVLV